MSLTCSSSLFFLLVEISPPLLRPVSLGLHLPAAAAGRLGQGQKDCQRFEEQEDESPSGRTQGGHAVEDRRQEEGGGRGGRRASSPSACSASPAPPTPPASPPPAPQLAGSVRGVCAKWGVFGKLKVETPCCEEKTYDLYMCVCVFRN